MKLIEITPDNHNIARKIKVKPEQDDFVASIQNTLVDAYVFKKSVFKLIEVEEEIVGYTLVFPFEKDEKRYVNIVRLAIDQTHQGKGYGRQSLEMIINWIKEDFEVDTVKITVDPINELARGLYNRVGFVEGEMENKELALFMEV